MFSCLVFFSKRTESSVYTFWIQFSNPFSDLNSPAGSRRSCSQSQQSTGEAFTIAFISFRVDSELELYLDFFKVHLKFTFYSEPLSETPYRGVEQLWPAYEVQLTCWVKVDCWSLHSSASSLCNRRLGSAEHLKAIPAEANRIYGVCEQLVLVCNLSLQNLWCWILWLYLCLLSWLTSSGRLLLRLGDTEWTCQGKGWFTIYGKGSFRGVNWTAIWRRMWHKEENYTKLN